MDTADSRSPCGGAAAAAVSGVTAVAVAVGESGYLPHGERLLVGSVCTRRTHCHLPGAGEGQGPPGWVLGCAGIQIFVHRQGNAG